MKPSSAVCNDYPDISRVETEGLMRLDEPIEKLTKLTTSGYESLLISQALRLLDVHTVEDLQALTPERLLQIPTLNQRRAERLFKALNKWLEAQHKRRASHGIKKATRRAPISASAYAVTDGIEQGFKI